MICKDDLVAIGYIKRPHGFKGEIQIELNKEIALSQGDFVFIDLDGQYIPYPIEKIKTAGRSVAQLRFIDSFEKAEQIAGHRIHIIGSEAEEEDIQIIGFTVEDKQIGPVGEVLDVLPYPQQQMLLVNYQDRDCLIPLVEAFIEDVDFDQRTIYTNLPEGLLDQ